MKSMSNQLVKYGSYNTATFGVKRLTRLSMLMLCIGAAGLGSGTYAQDPAAEPAKEALSSESVQKAVGSALSSIGNFFKKAVNAPEKAAEPNDEVNNDSGKAATSSTGLNIIDITQISSVSSSVLDPLCNEPVQPFGITDNAASLLMLAGKMKLQGSLSMLTPGGGGAPQYKPADVIKMAARNLNWLPQELEMKLGETLLQDTDILDERRNKASERIYRKARTVMDDLVKLLPQPLPYNFKILVSKASHRSASALPGGIIVADRDLFEDDADLDYAYFVIGHEISHVLQRHQTRAYQARLVDGIDTIENLSKFIASNQQSSPGSILAFGTSLKKLVVDFSEQQELQADSCSIRWMSQRLADPKKLQSKMQRITQQIAPVGKVTPNNLSGQNVIDVLKQLGDGVYERHPSGNQRRENILNTLQTVIAGQ
ncbi:hypothetical protein B9Z51_12160 [Limnohabitans sp. T6-5]|uniref:M48 family metalloprotease n=1 Tax=Limnohabitans sp. T6-5 TaxID=1100724 RepID=UPI000D34B931|nr:M48 family metalloprotease [Limnohabitans sp. T6-5]PUE06699.1 hypothetical protein B9Z51_12160 [Limnohabitans sp. T6-5]